jgi:outer membrane immunogenic protein
MRQFIGTLIVASLVAGPALAADMYFKAPPPPPRPPEWWTGFYLGANAGYTWGSNSVDTDGAKSYVNPLGSVGARAVAGALAQLGTTSFPANNNSFIGGGQIGYNYQFTSNFVAGFEADIQGVSASSSANEAAVTKLSGFAQHYTSTGSVTDKLDYLGTLRARLGITVTPTVLAYGTGGLAYGGVSTSTSFAATESLGPALYPPVSGAGSISDTRIGWTTGVGLEWMFGPPNWSAKAEYLYYDLGSATSNLTLTQINRAAARHPAWGSALVSSTTQFSGDIFRVGLNYKFGN